MTVVEKELSSSKTQDERAWEIYYRLRDKIETPENIGKLIIMDTDSGDYEIAPDELGIAETQRLQGRHPRVALYGLRIGYEAVASFDGGLERLP